MTYAEKQNETHGAEVERRYRDGETIAQICADMHYSNVTVREILKLRNVEIRRGGSQRRGMQPATIEMARKIKLLRSMNVCPHKIAKAAGRSVGHIYEMAKYELPEEQQTQSQS